MNKRIRKKVEKRRQVWENCMKALRDMAFEMAFQKRLEKSWELHGDLIHAGLPPGVGVRHWLGEVREPVDPVTEALKPRINYLRPIYIEYDLEYNKSCRECGIVYCKLDLTQYAKSVAW